MKRTKTLKKALEKTLCAILCCLLLATSFVAVTVSAETEAKTCVAYGVPLGAITVDGKIDDLWNSEGVVAYDVNAVRSGETADTASAKVKLLWDGTHLYVLAEITDTTKFTEGSSAWEEDSFETIISYSGYKIRRALRVGRDGTFSGSDESGNESTFAPGTWPWSYAARTETADGWIVEYQIQLNFAQADTGVQVKKAGSMEIDFAYNDGTAEQNGRRSLIGWGMSTDYGICTLTYKALSLGNNTIVLDGVIDDVWKNASAQTLTKRDGISNDSVTLKMLWDNNYLYILADIKDNTPHNSNEKWWNNDAIEVVFLAANNDDDDGTITRRYHLQRNGSFYGGGYFNQSTPLLAGQDNGAFWGSWKKPSYTADTTDGWIAEFAIPVNNSEIWGGSNKNVDKLVHIDVVYYSADSSSTSRTGLLGWSANGVNDSGTAVLSNLGKVTLSDDKVITTKLTGSSITVGSDLAMNYYVNVSDDTVKADLSKLAMRFTMNDIVKTVTEYAVVNGEYVFAFDGIAPQNMGDSIKAELLYNNKIIDVKDSYSIKDNAAELLSKNASDAGLVRVVTDLLNYGAAAQNYANYKTDALVNDVTGMAEASTAAPTEADQYVLTGNESEDVNIASASVLFDSVNKIGFTLNISDEMATNVKITLNETEVALADLENLGNGSYRLVTEALKATEFDQVFTLALSVHGEAVSTIAYSVNSYAYAMKDDARIGALASALYCLGVSADALNA